MNDYRRSPESVKDHDFNQTCHDFKFYSPENEPGKRRFRFGSHHFQVPAVDKNDSHRIRSMSFQQKWLENIAPTSKSMGFEHMNFTCCISKSKKTMVIWLLLGCKRNVHLFSLRISATSVQSCTSICGTGPQCTQCLD